MIIIASSEAVVLVKQECNVWPAPGICILARQTQLLLRAVSCAMPRWCPVLRNKMADRAAPVRVVLGNNNHIAGNTGRKNNKNFLQ